MQCMLFKFVEPVCMCTRFRLRCMECLLLHSWQVKRRGARSVMLHMQMPASIDTSDRALVDSDHCLLAEYDQPLYQLS
jgi:hypothetical protein